MANDFINDCIKSRRTVSVIIINGYVCKGVIVDFNNEAFKMKCADGEKLIFKSAVSTISK